MNQVVELAAAVRVGKRASVSRDITLVESRREDHRIQARELLNDLVSHPQSTVGKAARIGISGVPGVGKSTFIEALGTYLTGIGHKVAVLAVDPSSIRTRGSVLGDKTRMAKLSVDPQAYIRPSPSAGTLGGVARATSQAMTIVEAAGFDVVLVETVGVGQSEITVAGMVDSFLFRTIARTGDKLQGLKKGILEIADVLAVNKADGERVREAEVTARELSGALRLVYAGTQNWVPPVLTCSAIEGTGIDQVWNRLVRHREFMGSRGLAEKRTNQQIEFMLSLVRDELEQRLDRDTHIAQVRDEMRQALLAGDVTPGAGADAIIAAFDESVRAKTQNPDAS